MTNRKKTVHVVGEYSPTTTEGLSEIKFFYQMFWKAINTHGYDANLISGFKGDKRRFDQNYVNSEIKEGDIVVLLNPLSDVVDNLSFRKNYRGLIKDISSKIGNSRIVLAFQDLQAKKAMAFSGLFEINYSPIFHTESSDGYFHGEERRLDIAPSPEEAIDVVVRMIKGENPDVYAEKERKAA